MNTLGENLRRYRGGSSQADFANKLGIKNQQTYQRYEEGIRQPRMSVLHHMAGVIGVTVDALLGHAPGIVLKDIDAGSEAKYMAQTELEGANMTGYFAGRIKNFMDIMRRVPASHYPKLRADIDALLAQYQQWCEANHGNEKKLAAWKALTDQGDKEDPV